MGYTEIYFDKDDPEIVEYFEEMEKANNGEPYDAEVFRKWYSSPVPIYEPVEEGEVPDKIYCVLVTDEQYEQRKNVDMKVDKTFKKLENKWKKQDGSGLHVFGPKGKTQNAPEDRDDHGEDE